MFEDAGSPEAPSGAPSATPADVLESEVKTALGSIDADEMPSVGRVKILDDTREKLEKAKTDVSQDLSPEQKENLRKLLPAEKIEQTDSSVGEALDRIEQALAPEAKPASPEEANKSTQEVQPPTEVSDIPDEKSAGKQTMLDQVKGFLKGGGMTMIGPFIKGFIAMRRMFLDFFPPQDPEAAKKQLEGIERLYGQFFGATELQKLANDHLQGRKPPLKVIEGNFDSSAYGALKVTKFEEWITERHPTATEEQKTQIRENSFDDFLKKKIDEYVKLCQENGSYQVGEKDVVYVTTLTGIIEDQKPRKKDLPVQLSQEQQA